MIGVFDSGLGGLTVVRELMSQLPGYDLTYFGDTARTPYGPKSPTTVEQYAVEIVQWLLNNKARLIIVACNTASSVATKTLREKFDAPIFEVVSPAAKLVIQNPNIRRVGVVGTRATINSGVYDALIKAERPEVKIYSKACPLLVPLVEEGWLKKPETKQIVKKYLYSLKLKQIDTLILGCTHYPILKNIIQAKVGKRVRIIDSSQAIGGTIAKFLKTSKELDAGLSKNGHLRVCVSDITEHFKQIACDILGVPIALEEVRL
ncbi:MAG: glutamate racemase [Pseudomonadota bacterium]